MKIYSNKLDLAKFFRGISELEYVIIKPSQDLPNYYPGGDIDIFCLNMQEFGRKILTFGNEYVGIGLEIKVEESINGENLIIDFIDNEKIDFRFDLYSSLPHYKNVKIKAWLFYSVIDNRKRLQKKSNIEYTIFVPSEIDDLILRYIEYYEWYKRRPDKLKHIDYIRDKIVSGSIRNRFFDKLFLYTDMLSQEKPKSHILIKFNKKIIFNINKMISTPIHHIPRKLIRKIKKLHKN
ncbi:hypothetical protein ACFLRR_02470 [Bacteroidota bacterium]